MLGFFDKYPYTDFHELNLDWLLKAVQELASKMEGWTAANTIRYLGNWDITKQYPAWSVVVTNGAGYISKKPVPVGIDITNTDYWENVADFTALYADLGNRVSFLEDTAANWLKGKKVVCICCKTPLYGNSMNEFGCDILLFTFFMCIFVIASQN